MWVCGAFQECTQPQLQACFLAQRPATSGTLSACLEMGRAGQHEQDQEQGLKSEGEREASCM